MSIVVTPSKISPVSKELNEEIMIESSLAGNSSSVASQTIALDPTLTMDLTTMNPPGGHGDNDGGASTTVAAGGGDAAGGTSSAEDDVAGSTKEAASSPSKMDAEPERTHSDAPEANETDAVTVEDASDDDDVVVTEEAQSEEDAGGDGTVTNASKPTSPVTQGDSTASSPPKSPAAQDVSTTPAPSQDRTTTTSSPTLAPTMEVAPAKILMTSSPTVEYVKPGDDSLDPVANEKDAENELFENGEATPSKHDNSDDDELESGGRDDWDEDYDGKLSKDEEEEVKRVGGWLSFASIVLMIYTAYQMSENPDGICAR
jgi:hypothetical protein